MNGFDFQLGGYASTDHRQSVEHCRRERGARNFTPRHMDILRELAKGKSNKHIAKALMLSPETVKHHLKGIFSKLGVGARDDAVAEAHRRAMLE